MTETMQEAQADVFAMRKQLEFGMPTTGVGILVGLPKSGKSSLLADFQGAVIAELDEGDANHLTGRITDVKEIVDADGNLAVVGKDGQNNDVYGTKLWAFRRWLKAAIAHPEVRTIGIDTLDTLAGLFMDEVAAKAGVENMMVREKGVDTRAMWGNFKTKVETFIEYLNICGKLVVFASHYKQAEKDADNRVIGPAKINVAGASAEYILGRAKFIGYCYKDDIGGSQTFHVTFRGGPFAVWGSRIKELNGKTILLPETHPYGAIAAVLNGKTDTKQTPPTTEAKPANGDKPTKKTAAPKPRAKVTVGA